MAPLHPDDILAQLVRLAVENFGYLVLGALGIMVRKRGTFAAVIKGAAAAAARKRVETGEHAAAYSNGTVLAVQSTVLSVQMLRDQVADIRRMVERMSDEDWPGFQRKVDDRLRQQGEDNERYVQAMATSLTEYTRDQIAQLRSEYDTRIGGELAEIKAMLEGMKTK